MLQKVGSDRLGADFQKKVQKGARCFFLHVSLFASYGFSLSRGVLLWFLDELLAFALRLVGNIGKYQAFLLTERGGKGKGKGKTGVLSVCVPVTLCV